MQALRKSMAKPRKERPPAADESDPRPQVSAPTPMTMDGNQPQHFLPF
jgi:hypothetical protein